MNKWVEIIIINGNGGSKTAYKHENYQNKFHHLKTISAIVKEKLSTVYLKKIFNKIEKN